MLSLLLLVGGPMLSSFPVLVLLPISYWLVVGYILVCSGPRTGDGIYPGEIVEVVQIIEQPAAKHVWAQRFLRLAGDRGWVLENHPKVTFHLFVLHCDYVLVVIVAARLSILDYLSASTCVYCNRECVCRDCLCLLSATFIKQTQANYAIMVPVAGELIEDDSLRFVYSADCLEDLEVYNSPNCDEEHLTGLRLHPGAIVRACALWITTAAAVSSTITPGEEGATDDGLDGSEELQFVKMADNKGWVPVYHPITGGEILTLISQKPKPPPAPVEKAQKVEKFSPSKSSKNTTAINSEVSFDPPSAPAAVSAKTNKPPPPAATTTVSAPPESVSEKPKSKVSKSTEKATEKSSEKSADKVENKGGSSSGTSVKEKIAAKNKATTGSASTPPPAPPASSTSKATESVKTTPGKLSASIAKFETGVKSNSTSSTTKDAAAGGNALEQPRRRVVKPAVKDS